MKNNKGNIQNNKGIESPLSNIINEKKDDLSYCSDNNLNNSSTEQLSIEEVARLWLRINQTLQSFN
jgi:hypothetical protein